MCIPREKGVKAIEAIVVGWDGGRAEGAEEMSLAPGYPCATGQCTGLQSDKHIIRPDAWVALVPVLHSNAVYNPLIHFRRKG